MEMLNIAYIPRESFILNSLVSTHLSNAPASPLLPRDLKIILYFPVFLSKIYFKKRVRN